MAIMAISPPSSSLSNLCVAEGRGFGAFEQPVGAERERCVNRRRWKGKRHRVGYATWLLPPGPAKCHMDRCSSDTVAATKPH